jgi:hypothetical protein
VHPRFDQLIADMTAKEPGDRPTAAEACAILQEFAADQPRQAVLPEVAHLRSMMSGQAPPGRAIDSATNSPTNAGQEHLSRKRQPNAPQRAGQPPRIDSGH